MIEVEQAAERVQKVRGGVTLSEVYGRCDKAAWKMLSSDEMTLADWAVARLAADRDVRKLAYDDSRTAGEIAECITAAIQYKKTPAGPCWSLRDGCTLGLSEQFKLAVKVLSVPPDVRELHEWATIGRWLVNRLLLWTRQLNQTQEFVCDPNFTAHGRSPLDAIRRRMELEGEPLVMSPDPMAGDENTKDAQFPVGPIDWPTPRDDQFRPLHDPITEDWLRANGYQIESGRNDPRLPTRRLEIGRECAEPSRPFSSDDLCIEVSPCNPKRHDGRWHCWLVKCEPYRVIHVRYVRYTWELVRLYEGLTGRVWPGQCSVKGDEVPQ